MCKSVNKTTQLNPFPVQHTHTQTKKENKTVFWFTCTGFSSMTF